MVLALGLALSACGGEEDDPALGPRRDASEATQTAPDTELFESNVKYELLEVLENRGAVAPVMEDFSCTWPDDTRAECSGTGYDNAAEQSPCGYVLLPCGRFRAEVRAECEDTSGHGCQLEVDLTPWDDRASRAELRRQPCERIG